MFDQIRLTVTVKYVVLIGGVFATSAMTHYYLTHLAVQPIDWSKEITPVSRIVAARVALTTLIYAAINVNLISQIQKKQLELEKKKYAAEFVKAWYEPEMTEANVKTRKFINEYSENDKEKLLREITQDFDANVAATRISNFLEQMAHAIKFGLADEHYLRSFFFTIVRQRWHLLKPLIEQKRAIDQSDGFMCEFEEMSRRWSQASRQNSAQSGKGGCLARPPHTT